MMSVARIGAARALPDDALFVAGSTIMKRTRLIERLLARGRPYHCEACAISEWRGQPLVLHLDHINGVNNDNRLENLRLLCPNCHSQTDTYCRGPRRRKRAAP